MGPYLCIASNDVPPAVSKRVMLSVHCKYITLRKETFSKKSCKKFKSSDKKSKIIKWCL